MPEKLIKIDKSAEEIINNYFNIKIGNKSVITPYYMNTKKQKGGLRVLVGKGDPDEIARETITWAKIKGFDIKKANVEQIRNFMISCNIGVDCSGFVVHIINNILKKQGKKALISYIKFTNNSLSSKIKRFFRPIENIGANTLTNLTNCIAIENINDIETGDLIRSKGKVKNSHHVMMIYEVTKSDNDVKRIKYVHSMRYYEEENGIKFGEIEIIDNKLPLEKQNWLEIKNGINWTLQGYLNTVEDNGIRRLKIFA
jgi:hypothetical protein